jgi:hypothetical protein
MCYYKTAVVCGLSTVDKSQLTVVDCQPLTIILNNFLLLGILYQKNAHEKN